MRSPSQSRYKTAPTPPKIPRCPSVGTESCPSTHNPCKQTVCNLWRLALSTYQVFETHPSYRVYPQFLLLNRIPSPERTDSFIYSLVTVQLGCFQVTGNCEEPFCKHRWTGFCANMKFSLLLDKQREAEVLGHRVSVYCFTTSCQTIFQLSCTISGTSSSAWSPAFGVVNFVF